LNTQTRTNPQIRNGPNGTSDLKLSFSDREANLTQANKSKEIKAPIQKLNNSAVIPFCSPSTQPIPRASVPSAKPIQAPREISQMIQKNEASIGPANKSIT